MKGCKTAPPNSAARGRPLSPRRAPASPPPSFPSTEIPPRPVLPSSLIPRSRVRPRYRGTKLRGAACLMVAGMGVSDGDPPSLCGAGAWSGWVVAVSPTLHQPHAASSPW